MKTLADGTLTTLVLVARAEVSALREAARASKELASLGVRNQRLVINGVLREPSGDSTAVAFRRRQADALAGAPAALGATDCAGGDLVAGDVTGIDALRGLAGAALPSMDAFVPAIERFADDLPGLASLVDELDAAGNGS